MGKGKGKKREGGGGVRGGGEKREGESVLEAGVIRGGGRLTTGNRGEPRFGGKKRRMEGRSEEKGNSD